MDIIELGAIGELVGGVAVIGSLIFVGLQVRANTRVLTADAATRSQVAWAGLNRWVSEHPHRETLVRFLDPEESLSHFEANEMSVIVFMMRSTMQEFEAHFFQFRAGLLDPEVWEARARGLSSLLLIPTVADWWEQEKTIPIYTRSFLEAIEKTEGLQIAPEILTGGTGTGSSGGAR